MQSPQRKNRIHLRSIIHFLLMAIALSAAFSSSPLYAVITVTSNVSPGSVLSTLPTMGLGMGTAQYYNQVGNASLDERLEEAGVTTLRIGGGGYADVYHWSVTRQGNGISGNGFSPWFGQAGDFGYIGPNSDFAGFVNLLDRTDNSQAVVTVNYGSALKLAGGQSQIPDYGGQPKEAAAWVAYANADSSIYGTVSDIVIGVDEQGNDWKTAGYWAKLRDSTAGEYQTWAQTDGVYEPLNNFLAINRDSPIGIKYWEIGNETFGTGYYADCIASSCGGFSDGPDGWRGYSVDYRVPYAGNNQHRVHHPDLEPADYGANINNYAELMKSIDPSIKIGAVLATPPDDYSWQWPDKNFNGVKNSTELYWNDEVLTQAADNIDFVMVHWYPTASGNGASLLSEVRTKLPQMINGTTAGQDTGTNAGLRDTLAAYGIPDAEIMVTEFNYFGSITSGPANPAESIFVADAYATWLELGVTSVQYLELMTKDFLSDTGALTRGSAFYGIKMLNTMADPGDETILSTSNNTLVRVHSVLQQDGDVAVMILNTHPTEIANVTVNIDDLTLASDGTLYTLTGGLTMSGPLAATGLGNSFMASLDPRTISLFIIPQAVAPELLIGDYNNDGKVTAADYTVWRDSVGAESLQNRDPDNVGPVDLDDYESWIAHYGETSGDGSGSAILAGSVPEPSSLVLACLALVALVARFRARPRMA